MFVTQAHHFSHPQSSPGMQPHPTGAGQEVLHHPQTHLPEKQFGQGQRICVGKINVPFSLLPGGKQSWWFPKQEAKPGSFLTQFTPLPVQRGANCTSQSCLSRKVYPKGGQALLHSHPKSSPGRQLSSRDTPRSQLHSRNPWVWRNCHSSSICRFGDVPSLLWLHQEGSQPFPSGKERCWVLGRCWNNSRLKADCEMSCVKTNREALNQPQSQTLDTVWDHPVGKRHKVPQGTEWHQFHTECAQQLNEYLAGNWDHFKHFAGNPRSPKRELLLLGRSCWFPEFCFCE